MEPTSYILRLYDNRAKKMHYFLLKSIEWHKVACALKNSAGTEDNMKKIRRIFSLVIVLILILSVFTTACSSKAETVEDNVLPVEEGGPATDVKVEPEASGGSAKGSVATDTYDTAGPEAPVSAGVEMEKAMAGTAEAYSTADTSVVVEEYSPADISVATEDVMPGEDVDIFPIITETPIQPQARMLTAGEWNDNKNRDFLKKLLADEQQMNYKDYFTAWNLTPFDNICVTVTSADGYAIEGATVTLSDLQGNSIWTGSTDNTGAAYIFYNIEKQDDVPALITVDYQGLQTIYEVQSEDLESACANIVVEAAFMNINKLDLMFVIDTTGSMGDEISYLQAELKDVINRVKNDNANIPTNLSVNFYRDLGDDYVVRSNPFSDNIDEQLSYLSREFASGGGDYEEAVEQALNDAVYYHDWSEDSTKLLFLVLDAPPHNTAEIKQELANTLKEAAKLGIRIIPVASSGVDKDTEFLLRTFSMVTGGTYTFLTNHSGIGNSHIEPTIGSYEVEYLNDLLVRVIDSYLK